MNMKTKYYLKSKKIICEKKGGGIITFLQLKADFSKKREKNIPPPILFSSCVYHSMNERKMQGLENFAKRILSEKQPPPCPRRAVFCGAAPPPGHSGKRSGLHVFCPLRPGCARPALGNGFHGNRFHGKRPAPAWKGLPLLTVLCCTALGGAVYQEERAPAPCSRRGKKILKILLAFFCRITYNS